MNKKLLITFTFLIFILSFNTVLAACEGTGACSGITSEGTCNSTGGCGWVNDVSEDGCPDGAICLGNPLNNGDPGIPDINVLIGGVINAALGLVGSLALAMFIYGGFLWLTSGGNSEQVQKGKTVLIWATVGLIIVFTSYTLVRFVLTGLQSV